VFSTKNLGMIQNHALTYIKIIPIILTIIFGFVSFKYGTTQQVPAPTLTETEPTNFSHI